MGIAIPATDQFSIRTSQTLDAVYCLTNEICTRPVRTKDKFADGLRSTAVGKCDTKAAPPYEYFVFITARC